MIHPVEIYRMIPADMLATYEAGFLASLRHAERVSEAQRDLLAEIERNRRKSGAPALCANPSFMIC